MMQRFEDWEQRLAEILAERLNAPFVWGQNDCCLFAADCVEAMTGHDPASWFRDTYKAKAGAYAALKEFAGGSVSEAADKICSENGFAEETGVLFARRGDVALVGGNGSDALGVIDLTGMSIVVAGKNGLETVPLMEGKRVWRI